MDKITRSIAEAIAKDFAIIIDKRTNELFKLNNKLYTNLGNEKDTDLFLRSLDE